MTFKLTWTDSPTNTDTLIYSKCPLNPFQEQWYTHRYIKSLDGSVLFLRGQKHKGKHVRRVESLLTTSSRKASVNPRPRTTSYRPTTLFCVRLHLTTNGRSLCLSVLWLSQQLFFLSASHLAGVSLRTRGSAVSSVKLFVWAVLQKAASSNTGGQAIMQFRTSTFWKGTALVNKKQPAHNSTSTVYYVVLRRSWMLP